jgi:hypothetical protein
VNASQIPPNAKDGFLVRYFSHRKQVDIEAPQIREMLRKLGVPARFFRSKEGDCWFIVRIEHADKLPYDSEYYNEYYLPVTSDSGYSMYYKDVVELDRYLYAQYQNEQITWEDV